MSGLRLDFKAFGTASGDVVKVVEAGTVTTRGGSGGKDGQP